MNNMDYSSDSNPLGAENNQSTDLSGPTLLVKTNDKDCSFQTFSAMSEIKETHKPQSNAATMDINNVNHSETRLEPKIEEFIIENIPLHVPEISIALECLKEEPELIAKPKNQQVYEQNGKSTTDNLHHIPDADLNRPTELCSEEKMPLKIELDETVNDFGYVHDILVEDWERKNEDLDIKEDEEEDFELNKPGILSSKAKLVKVRTVPVPESQPNQTSNRNVNAHGQTAQADKGYAFQCDQCDYQTTKKSNLITHLLKHKNPEEVKEFNSDQGTTENEIANVTETLVRLVTVDYIKSIRFSSLPLLEKIKIKSAGRPKPNLVISIVSKCKSRDYKRTFKSETYEKTDWICGCDISNGFYCFPCLLFANNGSTTEWTTSGVKDLIHLSDKIRKHQCSKTHIAAKLEFNLLGKQDIRRQLNSAYRVSIKQHNEQVKKNRYVLSKIIDCIKFCGAFELALRGHSKGKNSLHPGIFKGLINFSAELDLALGEHLQQATVFKGTSKDIQNDLLECMLSVCQAHIKKEIADSKFVSVMSDDTSDISNIFQMVIILRYTLKNGTPVERFWSYQQPSDHDAVALADCIENVLNCVLKTSDQLISQSYDGTSVMSGVQDIINDKFPRAYYIHCYAHQMNLIMTQATSVNTNVRIFFSDLSDITNFFSNSPQRVAMLDEALGIPQVSSGRWNFKSKTIKTVYENREDLMSCMEKIQFRSRQSDTIIKAGALFRLLNDSKFVFWLTVFYRIMPRVDYLYLQLQRRTNDSLTIKRYIAEFENNIQTEKDNIDNIRDTDLDDIDVSQSSKRKKMDESNSHGSMTAQAKNVCDIIVSEMKRRFSFTDHLEIAMLFSVDRFETYSSTFPYKHLETAVRTFKLLDKKKLKTELEIIYKSTDFREVSGAVLLLKFLIENNLVADFSETSFVLYAIVTMPMMTTEADRCFSTLKRIRTFLTNAMSQDRLTALAMLSIEKEMIQDIPNFNELVIDEFTVKKKRRLQFQYKTCMY